MKKIFLSLIALAFAIPSFSQVLSPVKIDSLVTVSLPAGNQKKDTLSQQIYSGNGLYGYMVVIREANAKNNAPLQKERDLNKVLNDYTKGIKAQSPGSSTQYVRDTTIGTLKAKLFTLKTDADGSGTDIQYRKFALLYTRDATYTFEYVYPEDRKELISGEYKLFVNSIKFSPQLQRNDQYLSNVNGMAPIAKIGIYGGGALILVVLLTVVITRRRKLAVS